MVGGYHSHGAFPYTLWPRPIAAVNVCVGICLIDKRNSNSLNYSYISRRNYSETTMQSSKNKCTRIITIIS